MKITTHGSSTCEWVVNLPLSFYVVLFHYTVSDVIGQDWSLTLRWTASIICLCYNVLCGDVTVFISMFLFSDTMNCASCVVCCKSSNWQPASIVASARSCTEHRALTVQFTPGSMRLLLQLHHGRHHHIAPVYTYRWSFSNTCCFSAYFLALTDFWRTGE